MSHALVIDDRLRIAIHSIHMAWDITCHMMWSAMGTPFQEGNTIASPFSVSASAPDFCG